MNFHKGGILWNCNANKFRIAYFKFS